MELIRCSFYVFMLLLNQWTASSPHPWDGKQFFVFLIIIEN